MKSTFGNKKKWTGRCVEKNRYWGDRHDTIRSINIETIHRYFWYIEASPRQRVTRLCYWMTAGSGQGRRCQPNRQDDIESASYDARNMTAEIQQLVDIVKPV